MLVKKELNLGTQVSLAWTLLSLIVAVMLVLMLVNSALEQNNMAYIKLDPGVKGVRLLTNVFGLYLIMPVYTWVVDLFDIRLLKWVGMAIASLALVYFVLHHLSHIQYKERPDFTSHLLDLAHHTVGIWLVFLSIQWARFRPDAASQGR